MRNAITNTAKYGAAGCGLAAFAVACFIALIVAIAWASWSVAH